MVDVHVGSRAVFEPDHMGERMGILAHVPFPSLASLEDCVCDCVGSQDISKKSYWKVY